MELPLSWMLLLKIILSLGRSSLEPSSRGYMGKNMEIQPLAESGNLHVVGGSHENPHL
jgi:hypothetical protein